MSGPLANVSGHWLGYGVLGRLRGGPLRPVEVVLSMLTLFAPAPVAAGDIRANVPFSFTVDKKVLPAGKYNVTSSAAHTLLISSFGAGAVTMGQRAESTSGSPRLVFHRYGNDYILRKVWMGGASRLPAPRDGART